MPTVNKQRPNSDRRPKPGNVFQPLYRDPEVRHNRRSAHYLFEILDERGWTERTLAERAGLARSVVSTHLSGQRVIHRHHLNAYFKALDHPSERVVLLRAWLRDKIDTSIISCALPSLLDANSEDPK